MISFSIIIPTFNRAPFLSKAIDSVKKQSYKDWELIIIDDGSKDNTSEIVKEFLNDNRIKYYYQENAERSAARNKGISLSSGDFITFMDSDEYMDNNRLEKLQLAILENKNKVALYFTDIRFEFPDSSLNYIRRGKHFSFPIDPNKLIQTIIGNPQFCGSREVFQKHLFNHELTVGEDMELLFRISRDYSLIYLENNATITEIEHENRSVSFGNLSNVKQIETFKLMFSTQHPAFQVSTSLRRQKWSEVYLRASYYYIFHNNRIRAIYSLLISLFFKPEDKFKFKMNLFIKLSLFKNFDTIKKIFVG